MRIAAPKPVVIEDMRGFVVSSQKSMFEMRLDEDMACPAVELLRYRAFPQDPNLKIQAIHQQILVPAADDGLLAAFET